MKRTIYLSRCIFTGAQDQPFPGAVVVEGDRITFVGPKDALPPADPETVVEDLGDRTLMPGLIDVHTHSFMGIRMQQNQACFLNPRYTEEELIQAMTAFMEAHPDPVNGMYYFFDYDFEHSGRFTKYRLDRLFGDRAIMLTDLSLHGGAFSSSALALLGDDGTIPPGSDVLYEPDGTVGYWVEAAFFALHTRAMTLGGDSSDNETIDRIQHLFNRNGYTAIGEMRPLGNVSGYVWAQDLYLRRQREDSLTLRVGVCSSLVAHPDDWLADQEALKGDYIFFAGLKGFMDGGYINSTAWTTAQWLYGENKGKQTGPTSDMALYAAKIRQANDLGIPVRLHAEGDLAIEKAIEFYAQSENKGALNQIEHGTCMTEHTLQVIRDHLKDGRRLAVNMQPVFLYNEAPTDAHPASCGNEFYNRCAVRVRSILETGAVVSVGSTDFPVTQPIPADHIRVAVNRLSDEEGSVFYGRGYTPQEAISLPQALTGMTHSAALALGRDRDLGLLKPGYKADLVIFAQDLFAMEPQQYKDIQVYKTICNGKEVYVHV